MQEKGSWDGPSIPITVGVIGHRDLSPQDEQRIGRDIRAIVESYCARFPHSGVLLLSALAEGADQLAVRVCRDLPGVRVMAILPMPLEEYAEDFAPGPARDGLLACVADSEWTVPVDELVSPRAAFDVSSSVGRDAAYRLCGRVLSLASHVLIAVWDGAEPDLVGGTADTVYNRLRSGDPLPADLESSTLWPPERGLLVHVPVIRPGSSLAQPFTAEVSAGSGPWVLDENWTTRKWSAADADEVSTRIEEVNLDIRKTRTAGSATSNLMVAADRRALEFQTQYRRRAGSVLLAGLCLLLLINLQQSLGHSWLIGPVVTSFLVTGVLWWWLRRAGLRDHFILARAIAEGARVQEAWSRAGLKASPADFYLEGQPDIGWARRVLRTSWLLDRAAQGTPSHAEQSVRAWLEGQLAYLRGKGGRPGAIERNRSRADRYARLTAAGLAIAVTGLLLTLATILPFPGLSDTWNHLGQFLWELGLGIAAASAAYGQLLAYREVERQLQGAAEVFREGLTDLARTPTDMTPLDHAKVVALFVGREELRETSAWVALNRERSVRPI